MYKETRRAKKRAWTLAGLDRQERYVLWFDRDNWRWEITPASDPQAYLTLVTHTAPSPS